MSIWHIRERDITGWPIGMPSLNTVTANNVIVWVSNGNIRLTCKYLSSWSRKMIVSLTGKIYSAISCVT